MFTFAVGLTVAACGGVNGGSPDDEQQAQQQDDEAELKKKKKDAGTTDAGCVAQEDPGAIIAMYGMPPFHMDAGSTQPCAPQDAGHAKDAGKVKDSGSIHAMYGLPPEPIDEDAGSFHALYGMPPHNN